MKLFAIRQIASRHAEPHFQLMLAPDERTARMLSRRYYVGPEGCLSVATPSWLHDALAIGFMGRRTIREVILIGPGYIDWGDSLSIPTEGFDMKMFAVAPQKDSVFGCGFILAEDESAARKCLVLGPGFLRLTPHTWLDLQFRQGLGFYGPNADRLKLREVQSVEAGRVIWADAVPVPDTSGSTAASVG